MSLSKMGPCVLLRSSVCRFLNRYVIFSYTKEHGEFQSSCLRLYVISRPIFAFLHLRLLLQYRLQVKLQCLNYCMFRLLRVCDSFIDHETSCDIKSANRWLAFCLFLLWGFFMALVFPQLMYDLEGYKLFKDGN